MDALQVGATPAGVGRYVIELVRALEDVLGDEESLTVFAAEAARELVDLPVRRVKILPVPVGSTLRRIVRQQLALPRRMRGYDVVHYPDYLVPLIGRPEPSVVTIHDLSYFARADFFTRGQLALRRLVSPVAMRGAAAVLADSAFTRDEILRYFPTLAPERVRVVHLGVRPMADASPGEFAAVRARLRLPDEYVLSVGTLEPRKNLVRLIEAFAQPELAHRHLVLAGGRGWGGALESALAAAPPELRSRLTVTGFLTGAELAAIYRRATVFAYVSLYEGFGFPVLEAMDAGVPVVASDIPVLREMSDGAAAFVSPDDPSAIALALAQLLDDRRRRAELAARGTRNAARFTWRRCAEETLAVYRIASRSNSHR
jgi:glycosyltransferase involved in cell wall biosynthesis